MLIVISGPSGVGKDTIIDELTKKSSEYQRLVTTTTRKKRPDEVNGVNYHFVTKPVFMQLIEQNKLIEWAEVYGNYYGITKQAIHKAVATDKHILLRVDIQGALHIRNVITDALLIFLQPQSTDILNKRLIDRKYHEEDDIKNRLLQVSKEQQESRWFDYCVINVEDNLNSVVDNLTDIVKHVSDTQSALRR